MICFHVRLTTLLMILRSVLNNKLLIYVFLFLFHLSFICPRNSVVDRKYSVMYANLLVIYVVLIQLLRFK